MLDANLWAEPDQQGQKGTTTRKGSGARSTTAAATTTCRTALHSGSKRLKLAENKFAQSSFSWVFHASFYKFNYAAPSGMFLLLLLLYFVLLIPSLSLSLFALADLALPKRLKLVENKFPQRGFMSPFTQVSTNSTSFCFWPWHALHISNLSNHRRQKYNQTISRFFQSNIWRIFAIRPNCALCPTNRD